MNTMASQITGVLIVYSTASLAQCAGNSPVTCKFPAHWASDAENISTWWRHHVITVSIVVDVGGGVGGVLNTFLLFLLLLFLLAFLFSELTKPWLLIDYHILIWQVLPQLSCGNTCQIIMWLNGSECYVCIIRNIANGQINESGVYNGNPLPWKDDIRNETGPMCQHPWCHRDLSHISISDIYFVNFYWFLKTLIIR